MSASLRTRVVFSGLIIMAALAGAVRLAMAAPGTLTAEGGRARPGPALNRAQARAMLPAIDAYLDRDAGRLGFGGALDARLKPRTFCDASIIEIRPGETLSGAGAGSLTLSWRVGILMNCGEFARRGRTLVEGSAGGPGIGEVVTVAGLPGHYLARALDAGPPYRDQAWVHAHFSPGAATLVLNEKVAAPDLVYQARQAFGFPPGTRAVAG